MNNRNEIPFIHLFSTPLGYYFYDVNTNDIVKVNGETYEFLQSGTTEYMELVQKELNDLKRRGYLKTYVSLSDDFIDDKINGYERVYNVNSLERANELVDLIIQQLEGYLD